MNKTEISVDESQERQEELNKFSYFEPIAGMTFAVICTVIFGWFSEIITWSYYGTAYNNIAEGVIRLVPTFDKEVISSMIVLVIIWGLLRIAIDVFYLVERCYTKRLAIVSIAGNVLTLIASCIILIPSRIVNDEYVLHVHAAFQAGMAWFGEIIARPNIIILVLLLVILFLESFFAARKGWKSNKEKNEDEEAITNSQVDTYDQLRSDEEPIGT